MQKFTQLYSDAVHVIAGFPLTDDNYAHTVTLLKNRFGQPYNLVNARMEALYSTGGNHPIVYQVYNPFTTH